MKSKLQSIFIFVVVVLDVGSRQITFSVVSSFFAMGIVLNI